MILRPWWLLASLIPYAAADVDFQSPSGGSTQEGGSTLSITWKNSNTAPSVSELTTYQLFLCAGGQDATEQIQLSTLVTNGEFSTGNSASGVISAGLGGTGKNAYFLKMISVAEQGGTVINYSDRFTLTGMTGVFPATVQSALGSISGTSGPATENNVVASSPNNTPAAGGAAGGDAAAGGSYAIAYTMQLGPTRYAPMPPIPGTKITADKASRQYPTSAFTTAMTFMPIPNIQTTITASQTFSIESIENTAAAAAEPTDTAMARFLNRWKD